MAYDKKGEPVGVGDEVVLRGRVVKAIEDNDNVTIETIDPENQPKRMTTIATRACHLEVTKKADPPADSAPAPAATGQ